MRISGFEYMVFKFSLMVLSYDINFTLTGVYLIKFCIYYNTYIASSLVGKMTRHLMYWMPVFSFSSWMFFIRGRQYDKVLPEPV